MKKIIVIGGGASGLTAAITAKETAPGADVIILEHCDRPGRKILATGNGRCNLSNRNISPENYHGSVDAAALISRTETGEEFFGKMGVLTYADAQGRVYPHSESAATVLNVLRTRCAELGVQLKCGSEFSVKAIRTGVGARILTKEYTQRYLAIRIQNHFLFLEVLVTI